MSAVGINSGTGEQQSEVYSGHDMYLCNVILMLNTATRDSLSIPTVLTLSRRTPLPYQFQDYVAAYCVYAGSGKSKYRPHRRVKRMRLTFGEGTLLLEDAPDTVPISE